MHRIAPVLILVSLTAACQKEQALPQHQGSTATTTEVATSATEVSTTATPVSSAPGATATTAPAPIPAAPGAAVATTDGEQTGVTLSVTEFKRGSGGTLTLKFTIVNGGTEPYSFGYAMADPGNHGIDYSTIGGVHLIDAVNKKKYFVVRDSDNRCVCSRDLDKIPAGGRMNLWAKFPAPADAQRVTIVVPHFIPMDDVPIS